MDIGRVKIQYIDEAGKVRATAELQVTDDADLPTKSRRVANDLVQQFIRRGLEEVRK